jgi:fructose-bisphosphate aldolase class II
MPLVTSKELLLHALEHHYAVGAFNANNMEQIQAIVEAAEEERAPVILQVSQGAIRYAGLELAAGMVKVIAKLASIPVVLHLDHGTDFLQNIRCFRAGFTSLMYDGSKKPYEENVAITKRVCEMAHTVGIPVEAELGKVLQSKDNVTPEEVEAAMTDPDQAAEFIALTGADSLAAAVGSIHGMKSREAGLDIERIKAVQKATQVPLVLHGASGVRHDAVVEAIKHGICKVNVATYLNQAFVRGMREAMEEMPTNVDPRKFLAVGRDEVKEAVREKIRLFGSSGVISASGGMVDQPRQFRSAELGGTEA